MIKEVPDSNDRDRGMASSEWTRSKWLQSRMDALRDFLLSEFAEELDKGPLEDAVDGAVRIMRALQVQRKRVLGCVEHAIRDRPIDYKVLEDARKHLAWLDDGHCS